MRLALIAVATAISFSSVGQAGPDPKSEIERGKYLVSVISCTDCHTAGTLLGQPDVKRFLGGGNIGFAMPQGTYYAPNLTSDKETGLGNWSKADIVNALRTGVRPDGRVLAPIMPVASFKNLTDADAMAIAAYLKSLPAIHNKVPGPLGPNEKPVAFVMPIMPADVYMKVPKPPPPK